MSNVSTYVVDLRKITPVSAALSRSMAAASSGRVQSSSSSSSNGSANAGGANFRSGHHVRRSFVKGRDGSRQEMKVEENAGGSDPSGTDPEDSDAAAQGNYGAADITDVSGYENIFRPRQRELNRTPTRMDEPFEAPASGSEEMEAVPQPTQQQLQQPGRPSHLRVTKKIQGSKRPSPSPTRRTSQPSMGTG